MVTPLDDGFDRIEALQQQQNEGRLNTDQSDVTDSNNCNVHQLDR